ncbi:hypothetical protein Ancab_028490 [Ancistrocladus abbreviatus]
MRSGRKERMKEKEEGDRGGEEIGRDRCGGGGGGKKRREIKDGEKEEEVNGEGQEEVEGGRWGKGRRRKR